MSHQQEERGFTINDRRFSAKKESKSLSEEEKREKEPARKIKTAIEREETHKGKPFNRGKQLPQVTFVNFIFTLNTSALIHMGELKEPVSGKTETDMQLARHTIDVLGMLKEKTKGNLTKEEAMLLDDILYDLRMRCVKKSSFENGEK